MNAKGELSGRCTISESSPVAAGWNGPQPHSLGLSSVSGGAAVGCSRMNGFPGVKVPCCSGSRHPNNVPE